MDAFLTRRGADGLNFTLAGGTSEPANPKENTIWISTEQRITGWAFSPAEPETPQEGMVWIYTVNAAGIEINVLRRNAVELLLRHARQMIDGAWTPVEMRVYRDGQWSAAKAYLYRNGNEYEALTGGFKTHKGSDNGTGSSTFEKRENELYIYNKIGSNCVSAWRASYYTVNQIDPSGFKKLCAQTHSTNPTSRHRLVIAKTYQNAYKVDSGTHIARADTVLVSGDVLLEIDLSGVTESFFVGIGLATSYNDPDDQGDMTISEIWME